MYQSHNAQQCFQRYLENDSCAFLERTDDLDTLKPNYVNFDGKSSSTRYICHKLHTLPFIQSLKLTSVHDVVPVIRQLCRLYFQKKQNPYRYK